MKISAKLQAALFQKAEAIEKLAMDNPEIQDLAKEVWELLWNSETLTGK